MIHKYPKFLVQTGKSPGMTKDIVYCKLYENGNVKYILTNGKELKSYWSKTLFKIEIERDWWREIPISEAVLL